MNTIYDLDNTKFDALQKILTVLENCESVIIRDGQINHFINSLIVFADLQSILGSDFNLDVINPKKYIKLFKTMTRKNIKLIDDVSMGRYIISNSETKLFLQKKSNIKQMDSTILNKMKQIGNAIIIKENKKNIKNLIGTGEVKLLVNGNQFKGILVDGTGIYQFPDYSNDEINEENSDIYSSYNFLSIDADEYTLLLAKDKNDKMWIYTMINFDNNIKICMLENVTKRLKDNILI